MTYNFDEIINRENTACYKYDLREKYFGKKEILPMWVADMDFRTPDFVVEAIKKRVDHEIYAYTYRTDSLYQSVINWLDRRHQWLVKQEWIGFTPGVVPALNMAVLAFTNPGDKIIIQTPVYFPFYSAVKDHDRQLVTNPLVLNNGRYEMDFDHLKSQIDNTTRMLILCSPHNPTGNVWKQDELLELAKICLENNVLIISDEIHADIVFSGHKHVPTAKLSDEIAEHVVTLMAPSKTFNFAGLSTSYIITSNPEHFNRLNGMNEKLHLGSGNIFGGVALEAAYTHGDEWLEQLISYLEKNIEFAGEFINNDLTDIGLIKPEATFLLWIDFRNLLMNGKELTRKIIKDAELGLSDGRLFGTDGEGFQRMNIGCPKSLVKKALDQIKNTFT
jgi:cysteine-S-conjugate beta-lyase